MLDLIVLALVALLAVALGSWALIHLAVGFMIVAENVANHVVPSRRARIAADKAHWAKVRAWRLAHPIEDSDSEF